jgi:hypothetical protein
MNINIGWPEGIWIGLVMSGLIVSAVFHGEPKKGKYSFPVTFTSTIISLLLLLWGGFFK